MHAKADAKQEEFFLFDTGDIIEGTGLSDVTKVHGQEIFPIAQNVAYDGLTMGNHDIGRADTVTLMQQGFIPAMGGRYITSNSLDAATGKVSRARFTRLSAWCVVGNSVMYCVVLSRWGPTIA